MGEHDSKTVGMTRPAGVPIKHAGGLPAVRAAAPPTPPYRGPGTDTLDIMPSLGAVVKPTNWRDGDTYTVRVITSDPRDMWYLALPAKILPKQVEQIKRSGLGGDVWQQWMLGDLMADSWPMFKKCSHELRQAVANCNYVVRPYALEGEEPTDSALAKAVLVRMAMKGFRPDPATDERGFHGLVYHLTDALLNGLSAVELIWGEPERHADGQWRVLPRAVAWIHPRHYCFTVDGRLNFYENTYQWGQLNQKAANSTPPPGKVIIGQYMSRSGSVLGSGLMRPLATWWSYWIFGREWIATMAQKHGTPFLHASYKPGVTSELEKTAIENKLRDAGANNYMLYPEGVILNVVQAARLSTDNPIMFMMRQADEAPQYLLLGQTATTTATPGRLGGEGEHADVKRENVEALAGWVSRTLTEQFATAVVRRNYDDEEEVPTIETDFTEVASPEEQARRWAILTGVNMPPVLKSEFYRDNSLTEPEPGAEVVKNGQVGLMPNADVEVNAVPMPPMLPMGGGEASGTMDQDFEPDNGEVAARHMARLRAVMARASDGELKAILVKAEAAEGARVAGRLNGEAHELEAAIEAVGRR
jgi:phage gp29-like protein